MTRAQSTRADRPTRRVPVVALMVVALAAACSSTPATPSVAPSGAPAMLSTGAVDGASAAPGQTDEPPYTRVPELEAFLPSEVDGARMTIDSLTGSDAVADGSRIDQQQLVLFLAALGKKPADLAFAAAKDAAGQLPILVTVYRVAGLDGATIETAFVAKLRQSEPKSVVTEETIAGRKVTVVAPPNDPGAAVEVLFARSAYLFRVSASDRGHASDVVKLIK